MILNTNKLMSPLVAQNEYSVSPSAVIVHDALSTGSFYAMDSLTPKELQSKYLFNQSPNRDEFNRQYKTFVHTLREQVENVYFLTDLLPENGNRLISSTNPNQIYTRDSIITIPWLPFSYIPGNMKKSIRKPEIEAMVAACEQQGLSELCCVPENLVLEGGDVIPFIRKGRRTFLIGYGPRTQMETIKMLTKLLVPEYVDEIIAIKLVSWRINLDGAMMPVTDDVVVAQPDSILGGYIIDNKGAIEIDPLSMLKDMGFRIITVTIAESRLAQACNCLCLGDRRIITYDLSDRVDKLFRSYDIETIRIPGSELVKGTGGPRCMTRPLYTV